MTEPNKKPPVMSREHAEMRLEVKRKLALEVQARLAKDKAKKAIQAKKIKSKSITLSIEETKRGYLIFTSEREILGSLASKEDAEAIVSAFNDGDVKTLKRLRGQPHVKKAHSRLGEEIGFRISAA